MRRATWLSRNARSHFDSTFRQGPDVLRDDRSPLAFTILSLAMPILFGTVALMPFDFVGGTTQRFARARDEPRCPATDTSGMDSQPDAACLAIDPQMRRLSKAR
ncbi:MAG: hypothetical protein V4673_13700 [Pseudomonadota bacterium]